MADQTVKIENPDGKYRVASEMALMLWTGSHDGEYPTANNQEEYLELVSKCIQSLNFPGSRRI